MTVKGELSEAWLKITWPSDEKVEKKRQKGLPGSEVPLLAVLHWCLSVAAD